MGVVLLWFLLDVLLIDMCWVCWGWCLGLLVSEFGWDVVGFNGCVVVEGVGVVIVVYGLLLFFYLFEFLGLFFLIFFMVII